MKIYTFKHSSKKHSWFCLRKKSFRIRIGNEILLHRHHERCKFKLLLLQWKHFLEINYPMFQIQGFVVLKRHRFQWRRISFRILWVVFFFLMSRNVWPRMFCQYSKMESMRFKHSEEEFFEMIFWFCCQFVDNCS